MLIARNDGVDGRVIPGPRAAEAEHIFVVPERAWNVRGEEHRRDLADHRQVYYGAAEHAWELRGVAIGRPWVFPGTYGGPHLATS